MGLRYASHMKAFYQSRGSEFAVVAPLLPLLTVPLFRLLLEPSLPRPSQRALAVGLIVLPLALVIVGLLRALRLKPVAPRQLGPAALAVVLGALATVGVFATSLLI
jgi:hypothetical protein